MRRIVQALTDKGLHIESIKEGLTFTGEDSPMAKLMLSVMGATLAKQRGAYRGRKRAISDKDLQKLKLKDRVASGEKKAQVARSFGISREILYQYLRVGS